MEPSRPPMLVELFGLPGAGKTTLADATAEGLELLTRADLGAEWQRRSLLKKTAFVDRMLLDMGSVAPALRLAARAPLASGESLLRLARLSAKAQWLRSQSGLLLFDQGFLQDLWSILYAAGRYEPDIELLTPLLRSLYNGVEARIVFLDVDPETALRRIRGRSYGDSRFDRLPETELRDRLAGAARLPRAIIEAAQAAGLNVEVLDGAAPLTGLVEPLRSILTASRMEMDSGGRRVAIARRISVVGATGSGKTHLARILSDRLRLPIFQLDDLRWQEDGRARSDDEFAETITDLAAQDAWIIDGHYRSVRHLIWRRADTVVWLNYPLWVVARRRLGRFGRKRRAVNIGDMSTEPLVPQFTASWRSRLGRFRRNVRERRQYARLLGAPEYGELAIVELKSIAATNRWVEGLAWPKGGRRSRRRQARSKPSPPGTAGG